MRSIFVILVAIFGLVLIINADLHAQQTDESCARAESTADTMACAKKRNDAAQASLNELYQKMLDIFDEADAPNGEGSAADILRQSQTDWIAYRDTECEHQVAQVETESLKRLKKLSCSASLTEQRVTTLELELEEKDKQINPAQFEALPTWMNALASDHPEVFWRYGDRLSADLNCDEQNEEIIAGLQVDGANVLNSVLAIADDPVAGRPNTKIFDFEVLPEKEGRNVCSQNLKFSVIPLPVQKGQGSCAVALRVEDQKCASFTVAWTGKSYELLALSE